MKRILSLFVLMLLSMQVVFADDGFIPGGFDTGFLPGGFDTGFLPGGFDSGFLPGGFDPGFGSTPSDPAQPTPTVPTTPTTQPPAPVVPTTPTTNPIPPAPTNVFAPYFTSNPVTVATINTQYAYQVSVADTDGPFPLTLLLSSGPSGMTFNNQWLSWVPTSNQVGNHPVTLLVTDGMFTTLQSFTITVGLPPNNAPVMGAIGNKAVLEGQLLQFDLSATDADGDSLSFSTNSLPSGAVLNGQTFSWTPNFSQEGTYQVVFTVSDGRGGQDSEVVTINVAHSNQPPILGPIGNKFVYEGQTLTFPITFSDGDNDALNVEIPSWLPDGVTITNYNSYLEFSWTPSFTQAGGYVLTFGVHDQSGGSDAETIEITVYDTDQPAVWSVLSGKNVTQGSPDFTLVYENVDDECSDPDGNPQVTVENTSWAFDLLVWLGDLFMYNLDPFFTGSEEVVLACNGVPASFNLTVVPLQGPVRVEEESVNEGLFIGSIALADTAVEGSSVPVTLSFRNSGDAKLNDIKVKVSMPELGVRSVVAVVDDLGVNKRTSETLVVELPDDVEPGFYTVRITIDSGSVHRIVHRDIEIIE